MRHPESIGLRLELQLGRSEQTFLQGAGLEGERPDPPGPWVLLGFASRPLSPTGVCQCARPHQVCTSGLGLDQTAWWVSSHLSLGLQGRCHAPTSRGELRCFTDTPWP